ncbi:MAG: hypothetical protein WAQ27_02465 [Candidatus Microsaccharimonas sp.]
MKKSSRVTMKVAGVLLAAFVVATSLSACSSEPQKAPLNKDYLVQTNVEKVNCTTAEDPTEVANSLDTALTFVTVKATDRQKEEIIALNEGAESLDPLIAALNTQIINCGGSSQAGSDDPVVLTPEMKALLDAGLVPLDEFLCSTIVANAGGTVDANGVYALFIDSLLKVEKGNPDLRQWSDALSTLLKGKTPQEMKAWLDRAICEEPVIGYSLAHLFAHKDFILEAQSTDWLEVANVDVSEINDLAAKAAPLQVWYLQHRKKDAVAPDSVYLEAYQASQDYAEFASKLVFLLSRYQLGSVEKIGSTHHYKLADGGTTADFIPEVDIDTRVDDRDSLVFYLTSKTSCKPVDVIAFNTGDKRPMLGTIPESCEAPPVPTTPGTSTTPPSGCVGESCNPPVVICPVGNEDPDCAPKSSDPRYWTYPVDKPLVPLVTTPAETTPPAVVTEQTGGGGVVDTPTNTPESETGVTAPDVEAPAPSRTEAPTIPNEGTGSGPAPSVAPTAPPGDDGGF